MELRNTAQRTYKQLEQTLRGYGVFESGMAREEMEEIVAALELSSKQLDCNRSHQDLQQALAESEMDLAPLPEGCLSSTMIGSSQDYSSSPYAAVYVKLPPSASQELLQVPTTSRRARVCESPATQPVIFTVRADVHHPHDWSPSDRSHFQRKRLASQASSIYASIESDSKRSHLSATPNSGVLGAESIDSGVNWDDRGSSIFDEGPTMSIDFDLESALLASTSSIAISQRSARSCLSDDEVSVQNLSRFGIPSYNEILPF